MLLRNKVSLKWRSFSADFLHASKNHTRVMPFLLPPSEFKAQELTENGLTGSCELQICRSTGPWSLGTPARIEHSIQNAYLKGKAISYAKVCARLT